MDTPVHRQPKHTAQARRSGQECPPSLLHRLRAFAFPEGERSLREVLWIPPDISDGIGKVARITYQGVSVVALPDTPFADFTG